MVNVLVSYCLVGGQGYGFYGTSVPHVNRSLRTLRPNVPVKLPGPASVLLSWLMVLAVWIQITVFPGGVAVRFE